MNHTTREAARLLGLSPRAVRYLARRRHLGHILYGRLTFTPTEIRAMKTRRGGPAPKAPAAPHES